MINKETIQTIKDKEMDRKDFLKYSGLVLLSVVGLKTVATFLNQSNQSKIVASNKDARRGFGGGKYGA